jgi:N-methylhydantoinase A
MTRRIGIDIGGTFTDFTLVEDDGRVVLWKEDSTPDEPVRAIELGLRALAEMSRAPLAQLLGTTDLFVHGSTIATNTVIQRNGPPIGLLCTLGFRDIVHLRDGFKPERFNIHLKHPGEFVPRYLRLGVEERMNSRGEVVRALDEAGVRAQAARFREEGVVAVAIAFLWSIMNPAHERRAAEILLEELPGVHVIQSADVLPEIREWERTSASVLSAYILPGIAHYLRALAARLTQWGYPRAPLIMQVNGGCAAVEEILRRPVTALASGPAAAPAAAVYHAHDLATRNLISVDMGGTSFDVCLIRDGRAGMSRTIQVEQQPIGVAGVEVHSVGAGGGSIAWLDGGGALRVGPRSAGARPGPACYGQGGVHPTVTDANVVLGFLDPSAFLGGRRTLDAERARAAVTSDIAAPLKLDVLRAAAGIIEVVDANMVDAIRAVSIERGIDPRGFTLVSAGGAGGLHGVRLARKLGMARVLVPAEAGTFCAFGMTVTDVRHDHTEPLHLRTGQVDLMRLNALLADLEARARARLRADGFADTRIALERAVDARYPNQVHELTVPVAASAQLNAADIAALEAAFHAEHQRRFTYALPALDVECLHWRVTAIGRTEATPVAPATSSVASAAKPKGARLAWHGSDGMLSYAVYDLAALPPGGELVGPAILEAATTTILLERGDRLHVRAAGSYLIDVSGVSA